MKLNKYLVTPHIDVMFARLTDESREALIELENDIQSGKKMVDVALEDSEQSKYVCNILSHLGYYVCEYKSYIRVFV